MTDEEAAERWANFRPPSLPNQRVLDRALENAKAMVAGKIPRGRASTNEQKRIVLDRIYEAWIRTNDMRLCQLLINAATIDPFYVEDFDAASNCEAYVNR